jgi:hypothetical protein
MKTPQADIDWALRVEKSVTDANREVYLDYLNQKPMSERTADQEVRDGCILTGLFVRWRDGDSAERDDRN